MAATFFLSWLFVIPACMSLGFTYEELEKAAVSYCGKIITSVFILLSVGGMIGAWIAAGTVSAIVDCGTSDDNTQNFSSGYVYCRSVVRNGVRYFLGDIRYHWYCDVCRGTGARSSPGHDSRSSGQCRVPGRWLFSDVGQPNLASAVTGVKLMDHVRHLAKIQFPAFIISAVLYTILGFVYAGGEVQNETTLMIIKTLGDNYNVGLIAFLPALIVIILLLLKKSAIISILISAATGIGVAVIYQGKSLAYVLTCFWSGVKSDTGMELVDTLLSRGGVTSLFSSASLYLITFGLIGILTQAGVLDAVVAPNC